MMKFQGTLDELQKILRDCGATVDSCDETDRGYCLRTREGMTITWYSASTGTVQVQGKSSDTLKNMLEKKIAALEGGVADVGSRAKGGVAISPKSVSASKKIFVVHGHDAAALEQLELILHKLQLPYVVLSKTGGGGLTIIESLEKEIGRPSRFGVVLMTPDDMGYAKGAGSDKAEPRARQNVVLEMGMLISAVGRENIAVLKKGHLEAPSDTAGILYIPFNDHVKETVPKLTDRLSGAGFGLNPQDISDAGM